MIAVRGKFDFSVFNLFFPVKDIQVMRLNFSQNRLRIYKVAVRLNFALHG